MLAIIIFVCSFDYRSWRVIIGLFLWITSLRKSLDLIWAIL